MRSDTHLLILLFSFFTLISLCSCTEEIQLEEIAQTQLVFEGQIVEGQTARITLSKTISKTLDEPFPTIDNATVRMTTSSGDTEVLSFVGNGRYESSLIVGQLDTEYRLAIELDGTNYLAQSIMPAEAVVIDSVRHQYEYDVELNDTISSFKILFSTLPSYESYFIAKITPNRSQEDRYFFFTEGKDEGAFQVFNIQLSRRMVSGSEAKIEVWQVDEAVYDFFKNINNRNEEGFVEGASVSPPATPRTNFNQDVIGYFAAMTTDSVDLIIQ